MSTLRLTAFSLVMALYLAYPAWLIYQQERVLNRGTAYDFPLEPVDPVDAFRGRFLALNFRSQGVPAPAGLSTGQVIYLTIDTDAQGFARFTQALTEPPAAGDYLKATAGYLDSALVYPQFPDHLLRYYLNEEIAPLAEQRFNELMAERLESGDMERIPAYARLRLRNGQALIEQLYFEDRPLREYLKDTE